MGISNCRQGVILIAVNRRGLPFAAHRFYSRTLRHPGPASPPLLNAATFAIPPGEGPRVAVRFLLELVLTSAILGAAAGWFLGHTPAAALSTAVAGVAFALGPGHNIPLLGNTLGAGKGLALLATIILVSAYVLVESAFYLSKS